MMKKYTKLFAVLLCALLAVALIIPFATAETTLLSGQKELFVKTVTTPPVQDGILNGHEINGVTVDEYGSGGPTFCLTAEDMRAVDLEGKPLDIELPSYVYLYMAKDADALYLAMEIQEDAHGGDLYEFTTFLGFGDPEDADTMNSGITTVFKMDNGNSANFDPGTWMDTQVTELTARSVAADGTVTDTTSKRKFQNPIEYTLPAWASESKVGTTPVTIFEAELDFEDAMLGSGLDANADLPDHAYFAFELGVFNGTTKIGKIVFNNDMTGKDEAPDGQIKTVPHFINLKEEFNSSSANNANLSALSVKDGVLSPAFSANTTEYTLTLPNGVTSADVTATAAAAETRVTVKGADDIDGITAGGNETITVTCVAQNGYVKVYTLNVVWSYENTDYYVDATAGDDSTGNGSSEKPYATIEKALETIAAREWNVDEMATVHINGTFDASVSAEGVLWSTKTVFTKAATRLPITIKGDSETGDVIHAYAGKAACANSYHFDTLTFAIDSVANAKLYAGSGEVRFDNTNWTTASAVASNNTVFYGDSFTAKVFEGWTATEIAKAKSQNENGNISTSITIGSNSQYWIAGSAGYYMSAIGDVGGWDNTTGIAVTSDMVEVSVILDGSRVSKLCIHDIETSTTTTYAKANIFVYNDDSSIHMAGIDKNTTGCAVINADVEIGIYAGKSIGTNSAQTSSSSYLRGGRNDTVNGNFTITVESGAWQYVQGGLGSMHINGNYECNFGGTAYINRDGTDSNGKEYGEGFYGYSGNGTLTDAITGTVTHNVYGGYIKNYYGIHGNSTITKNNIVHNISGGTIVNYYGAGTSKTTLKNTANIVNNFSGGTISGEIFCAGYKNSAGTAPKVINNISGDVVFKSEFRGAYNGTYPIVENNVSGGTFNTTYNGVYNSGTKKVYTKVTGGEWKSVFYIAYFATNSADLVETEINAGTFNSTILGAYGGSIGKVTNKISGGTFNGAGAVYLGAGSTTWPSVVGSIENTITGGDFNVRVYGGGQSCHVTGNIVNNIYGGDLGSYYGGINTSYYSATTTNMLGVTVDGTTAAENSPYYKLGVAGKIINTFGKEGEAGPTFSDPCFGGDLAASREVLNSNSVENTFYSGTWNSTVYGGSDNSNIKVTSVTNTVKGGTFTKFFTAGSYNAPIASLTTNVEGGAFKSYFFGGSRRGNISGDVINNISGGTFESYFFGGSDQNTSSANDTTSPITYTIEGSIKNTISGGTFKSAASGAGFGTVKGNVENTIKGTARFELGYYGVQATVMETVVEGNVLNLITKDAEGNAPYFAKKNKDIDYVYDNSDYVKVYTTSGSNIGFAATSGSGVLYMDDAKSTSDDVAITDFTDIKGYVETIVEAGEFAGHYYLGGGVDVFGVNEDGYGVINIVRGDPVFNYVWSGGCISSSREGAPKTYTEINSGTFNKQFSVFNRTATSGSLANATETVTVIKGGVFNSRIEFSEPWTNSHCNQHQRTAPSTLTIEGGTFNDNVYGLGYLNNSEIVGLFLAEGGTSTINVNGGTFAKNIYAAGYPYTADKFVGEAVINIEPTKGDVTILGTVEARFDKEIVNLKGGEYKLILGADASIEATSATGDVKIGQAEKWNKQVYVTLPEGNNASVSVTGAHCFDQIGSSVVAVKGGVQLAGATMILTDRVAVRALFDKESVDSIEDFTFSFTMNGSVLAEGSKKDLEAYGTDYYGIVLAKIGANDFTKAVTFAGNGDVWEYEFSIKSLAVSAEAAWAGNAEGVALAKAMQNFATIVADPTASLPHDLAPDLTKLEGFTATASRDEGTTFTANSKGLIMGNAVGIRIYGTSQVDVTDGFFTIKVNGIDVTDLAVITAGENNAYTIDLYVNAKSMSTPLNIVITEKSTNKVCLNLTDRVDAIAAAYPESSENYDTVQQLLVYIQAAVDYARAQEQAMQ